MIQDAGFTLRETMPSVGAAVGTAVHAANSHMLVGKIETGELAPVADGVEIAIQAFRAEIAPGAEWDETTPNLQVAEFQIRRMVEAYVPVARTLRPALVETELRANIAPDWVLTGHVDLYEDGAVPGPDDTKTGALERPYQAQLGGYSLLLKSNGYPVQRVGTTFIPRARKTKPQPPAIRQAFDLETAERAAFATVQAIKTAAEKFAETGDPYAFSANPMSLMCSSRYCPAWGTKFCTLHLTKEEDHGPID